MASYKIRLNTSTKYLLVLSSLVFITLICAAFSLNGKDDFELAKQEVLLRKVGHEILLHSGDSTSRVLPIKKVAENEYQIKFENEFTFQPDSLVKIIASSLSKDKLAEHYIINVLNCFGNDVVFAYAISKNEQDNIVSCSGRLQPKACYIIDVKFQSQGIGSLEKGYLLGGLPLLAFVGLLITKSVQTKAKPILASNKSNECFNIGYTLFDAQQRSLLFSGTLTTLTAKENKMLLIFASTPNVIIERSRLQKELWEDEGVIVGRSLDMFISKLRKKLELDLSIQLINIHGKGYKLEINPSIVMV